MQHTENTNHQFSDLTTRQSTANREISLIDCIEVIVKRWRMIAAIILSVTVVSTVFTLFMPNLYTAKSMIIPGDDDKGGMGALMSQLGGLAGLAGVGGSKSTGDLYVTMLKSEALKDQLIDRFKLMDVYKTQFRTNVYAALDTSTLIALGKKDGVIVIMVDNKDPKWAADLANGYVEELGKLTTRLNMASAGNNRSFYEKRLLDAKSDLIKAEDALKEFQSKNKVVSVTDQAQAAISAIAQLKAQLATQEVQLVVLQRQFTDSSQEVKAAKASISKLRTQLSGLEGKSSGSSSIPSVGNVPQLGQEYLRLMREYKIQEAVFEMLTKQSEFTQLSESKDVPSFQVLQKATVPEKKSKPVRKKIVLIAGFVASFLSILAAFFLELVQKISSEDRNRWDKIKTDLPKFTRCLLPKGQTD
jgi:uncharacterized protein involved in exopolysaccharide biosynthesis